MPLKQYDYFDSNESCNFCTRNEVDVLYGPVYKCKQKSKLIVVHYFCLLMASKIKQYGRDNQGILGFFPRDIWKELKRGNSLLCDYCGLSGATVHCVRKDCNKIFHLPCGIAKGSVHQFFDQFDSFCHLHRPKQNVNHNIFSNIKESCVICSLSIDKWNKYDSIWPTCCKPSVFLHRKCIQIMATNAGYYFKCPLCNNTEIFRKEMQRLGIYVPEQEASWESEPHAYEELLTRGSGCEAKKCCCPSGRDFSKKNTGWQLELCKVCGGNGVHLSCCTKWNKTQGYLFNWFCEICKPVFLENRSSTTPERPVENADIPEVENFNDDSNLSSASSEKLVYISQLRPQNLLPSLEVKASNSASVQQTNQDPVTSRDSDEDVIVVSEDEQVGEPPKNLTTETKDRMTGCESSDDDCQIVSVETSKRRKRGHNNNKKRFRTAPWMPEAAIVSLNNGTSMNSSENNSAICNSPNKMQCDQEQGKEGCKGQRIKEELPPATSTVSTFYTNPLNERPTSKPDQLNNLISSDSLFDPLKRSSIHNSISPKKQNSYLLEKSKCESIASNISLNLSEVSINRIVSKPSVPVSRPSSQSDQIIDLSLDDDDDTSLTQLEGTSFVHKETVNNKLSNLCNLPDQDSKKRLDQWFDAQIVQPGSSKTSKVKICRGTTNNVSSFLKNLNPSITIQVILSSDDEKETSELNSSKDNIKVIPKSPNSSKIVPVEKNEVFSDLPIPSKKIKLTQAPFCPEPSSDSIEEVTLANPTLSEGSILKTVLSNSLNYEKSEVLTMHHVLIVSDDEDNTTDNYRMENLIDNNNVTSDYQVPENDSNSWCITRVMTLADPNCFHSEDSCVKVENNVTECYLEDATDKVQMIESESKVSLSINDSISENTLSIKDNYLSNEESVCIANEKPKVNHDCSTRNTCQICMVLPCNSVSSEEKETFNRNKPESNNLLNPNNDHSIESDAGKDCCQNMNNETTSLLSCEQIVSSTVSSDIVQKLDPSPEQICARCSCHISCHNSLKKDLLPDVAGCEESVSSTTDGSYAVNVPNINNNVPEKDM